jgi:uncharacterized membrane protein
MQMLLWMYIVMSVILILLAIPLWLEKIPPNGLYGFRIRKTLENEKVWYAVNRYFAPWLVAAGIGVALSAFLLLLFTGISIDLYALSVLGVLVVIFAAGLGATIQFMNAICKE